MRPESLAVFPIWLAGLLIVGIAVAAAIVVELAARRLVPQRLRQAHNPVASAMFTVIGTTYAVLLAFIAMLSWDGFNRARVVTDTEASLAENVHHLIAGLTGPEAPSMRADITAYVRAVIHAEWPAQLRGAPPDDDSPSLRHLTDTALRLRPDNIADGDLHTLLLGDLNRLDNARRERLLIARTPIPSVVWFVLVAGGAITVVFGSFLGAPSLAMHLAMSSLLAASGALVLLVIVALSNPFRGDFSIPPDPFARVLAGMSAAAASGDAAPATR